MRLANRFRLITAIHALLPLLTLTLASGKSGLLIHSQFQDSLGIACIAAFFIIFLSPYGPTLAWLVRTPLNRVMAFCCKVQENRDPYFSLPPQNDDENEFITLMRHMNWMARKIRIRESELAERVKERTLALEDAYHHLEQARDAAEASNRAKDAFLATMSHEIRTPIHAISGMCDVLLRTPLTSSQSEHLRVIQTASQSLLDQMTATLDFTRISAGRLPIHEAPFRIREMVEEVCSMFSAEAGKKDLELIADVDEKVPSTLSGDGPKIRQVLINLLGNALKFTESGEICLEVRTLSPGALHFGVRDTGIGIAPECRADIFLPFTQADGSITRRYGGTGLGLAICRGMIDHMGGTMDMESCEGKGSHFYFSLPLSPLLLCQNRPDVPESIQSLHCLVVEDHPVTARVLCRYLRDFGFTEQHSESAEGLRRAISQTPLPDLILMDISLKDTDGLTLCRELASMERHPPVILMGGRPGEEGLAMACPGCLAFLPKPLRQSTLFDTIMEIFGSDARIHPCPSQNPGMGMKGLRVLLVEDNSVNRMVAEELLQPAGIEVLCAASGPEALDILAKQSVDIILMDIRMRGMDGRETTRRIRRIPGMETIPVIALTADAGPEEEAISRMAGMNAHLTKPLHSQTLFNLLSIHSPHRFQIHENHIEADILDKKGALSRFTGNEKLYGKVLDEFRRHQAGLPGAIRRALRRGETDEARLLAHTLKGSAANIGARLLADAAKKVEQQIRKGCGEEDLPHHLSFLDKTMDTLLHAVQNDPQISPLCGHGDRYSTCLSSELEELDTLLAASSMSAKARTAELEGALADCGRARDFRRLMDAAECYDFQKARHILQDIRISLPKPLPATHEKASA
ncbi:response regulator [Desulfobotulus sp. H1]|uniref:histidine kinase n=1 Tax=Desulfobotulus pelophilus TaxID=2823377 RepID=A0ABT3NBQ0_9BACT|nr:response regulator [Desulfobotulus pelophilus]MCW7754884.1 response regulator [Desulfobotulus pelophilus]